MFQDLFGKLGAECSRNGHLRWAVARESAGFVFVQSSIGSLTRGSL